MYCKCKNTRTYNCNICGKPEEPISLPSKEEIAIIICDHLQDRDYGKRGYCETCGKKAKAIAKRIGVINDT